MIWLTWRQHRKQAMFTLAGLAALAAVLIPTGLQMHNSLVSTGLAECLGKWGTAEFVAVAPGQACDGAAEKFNNAYGDRAFLAVLLMLLPLLMGLFWGAPLVAGEVEHGTHRLVWTQGISRLRWALVKFGVVGGATVLVAMGYALLVSWWIAPIARAGEGGFGYMSFDIQGVAPVGYTLFAVALGIAAGTVVRKVLPAMALTLVVFVAARFAVAIAARPHFNEPLARRFPVVSDQMPNPTSGDWILSRGIYDGSGNLIAANTSGNCHLTEADICGGLDRFNVWSYQPGGRFWLFQYLEAGLFTGLALLMLYLALHNIRRRIT